MTYDRNYIIIIILVVIIAIIGAFLAIKLNGYIEVGGSTIKDPSESKVVFTGTFVGSITQASPSMPTCTVFKVGDEYVFISCMIMQF